MKKKDTKTTGALTVLAFAYESVKRGAVVSEPIGDNSRYDLIVDNGKRLFRVQVKSASPQKSGAYNVNGTRKVFNGEKVVSIPYQPGELDCLATFAEGTWFFFPEPDKLPGIVQVRPSASEHDYKWNFGKDKWAVLGLADESSNTSAECSPAK